MKNTPVADIVMTLRGESITVPVESISTVESTGSERFAVVETKHGTTIRNMKNIFITVHS